jgi:hypothetical protein
MPAPYPAVPRRNLTPEEQQALWSQGSQGMQPAMGPMSLADMVMEPAGALLDEADLSKYLLPLSLLGMVKGARGKAPAAAKGLDAKAVLREAKKDVLDPQFAKFRKENPNVGRTMFDLEGAQPALPERTGQLERNVPKQPSARLTDALVNPQVGQTLRETVEQGIAAMPESWYRTSPLYERFVAEYGADAPKVYQQFMQSVAATSPRNPVPQNIKTASLYNWMTRQGIPFPQTPPPGYGNIAQKHHRENTLKFLAGTYDIPNKPKPPSFAENLLGNELPVTADTHNFRMLGIAAEDPRFLASSVQIPKLDAAGNVVKNKKGEIQYDYLKPREMYKSGELTMDEALNRPAFWDSAPSAATEYGPYETWQQKQAAEMGISPARWQETMWVGGGEKTGLASPPEPFLATLAARIHYTAAKMGTTPEKVLDLFVKGQIPLLGLGAGAAVMSQQQEPEKPLY